MDILIPILTLGVLGILFGVGLALASKKFSVEVDPRLERITGLLPGANCGACGGAGCFGFAEGLLSGKMSIEACRVSAEEVKEKIARLLGKTVEKKVKKIAVLHCNGGRKVADRFIYHGIKDCSSANSVLGGQKDCVFGCLGFGSCVDACPFGAITMSEEHLPVIDKDTCRACNKCAIACPKKLFSLVALTSSVWVACSSHELGKDTKTVCAVGCIACKLCEKACKFSAESAVGGEGGSATVCGGDAIHVLDNLAVIDYHKCTSCGECVKVCPMKTIHIRP